MDISKYFLHPAATTVVQTTVISYASDSSLAPTTSHKHLIVCLQTARQCSFQITSLLSSKSVLVASYLIQSEFTALLWPIRPCICTDMVAMATSSYLNSDSLIKSE